MSDLGVEISSLEEDGFRKAAPDGVFSSEVFLFSFQTDLSRPVLVESQGAIVDGLFRHFNTTDIEIGASGDLGQLNLGFRLCNSDDLTVFEDRAKFSRSFIEAGNWVPCQIRIPSKYLDFESEYRLFVDLVRENQFWFSDYTGEKLEFNLSFSDADRVRREEIAELQRPTLEESLSRAFARVSELEHAERMLLTERDVYRAERDHLKDRLSREIQNIGLLPPPAAVIAEMLRAFDPVQRRDRWLDALSSLGLSGSLFGMYPHDGRAGSLQILVYGSGGYGDMIYLGVVVRELREHFGHCNLFVMHESLHVEAVFGSNPHVTAAFSMNAQQRYSFMQLVHSIDVFDLVVDVKYAVTYTTPPLSRVPTTFQQRAIHSSAEWQKYVRYDWPHMNNLLSNTVTARGMTKLDLVGQSSLLPINRHSDIDLFVPEHAIRIFPALVGKAFVTIHHGADRAMAASPGLQTKNLASSTWVDIVMRLRANGLIVVQLGEKHEIYITGTDVDLRGETSLIETAFVIKTASVHIDTEGGLVHVARAVNTPAVVAFGPTPVAFFGYPQNENIPPRLCGNCWWVTRKWAAECPRGLGVPECMESHDPANIVQRAVAIAERRPRIRLDPVSSLGETSRTVTLTSLIERIGAVEGCGLILVAPDQDPQEVFDAAIQRFPDALLLIRARNFQKYYDDLSREIRVKPYSFGNIPLTTASYDWAVGVGMDIRNEVGLHLAVDLHRCVRPDGPCYIIAANIAQPISSEEWMENTAAASTRMQGRKADLEFGEAPSNEMSNYMLLRLNTVTE